MRDFNARCVDIVGTCSDYYSGALIKMYSFNSFLIADLPFITGKK